MGATLMVVLCAVVQAVPGSRGLLSSLLTGAQETNSSCHVAACHQSHGAEHTSFVNFFPDASFTNGHEQFLPDISQDQFIMATTSSKTQRWAGASLTRSILSQQLRRKMSADWCL